MSPDDFREAERMHELGVLSLKAMAWVLVRYRAQRGHEVTPDDLMRDYGAKKTAAYRTLAELRLALSSSPERINDSRIPGFPDSGNAGKSFPENGNSPTPPIRNELKEIECGCGARTHATPPGPEPEAGAPPEPEPAPAPSRQTLRHAEADLDALAERLEALAPGSYWGMKVRQFAPMYPLGWIEEAAQIGAAKGKGWEFVAGILRRYQRDGGPERGPATAQLPATGTDHAPRGAAGVARRRGELDGDAFDRIAAEAERIGGKR